MPKQAWQVSRPLLTCVSEFPNNAHFGQTTPTLGTADGITVVRESTADGITLGKQRPLLFGNCRRHHFQTTPTLGKKKEINTTVHKYADTKDQKKGQPSLLLFILCLRSPPRATNAPTWAAPTGWATLFCACGDIQVEVKTRTQTHTHTHNVC